MQEKNYFKFGLYVGKQVISERIFDADVYNPSTRYDINIKSMNSEIMASFQRILSSRGKYKDVHGEDSFLNFRYYTGKDTNGNEKVLELDKFDYTLSHLPSDLYEAFRWNLSINNNIIIEREFSVNKFNKKALFSTDITDQVDYWVAMIQEYIKKKDASQMWEENAIVSHYGYGVKDVRGLNKEEKATLISSIAKN